MGTVDVKGFGSEQISKQKEFGFGSISAMPQFDVCMPWG